METIILVGIEFNKKTKLKKNESILYVHLSVRLAVLKISVDDSQA